MFAAAATLSLEEASRDEESGDGLPPFPWTPSPSTETALRPWPPAGRPWPRTGDIVLGRSTFLLNLVDIARVRPARPDKLELWRYSRLSPAPGLR